MARKPTKSRSLTQQSSKPKLPDGLVSLEPVAYPLGDTEITALQIYHNPDRKPSGDGPWNDEAEKIAWVDQDTGLGCIILRQKNGTLSGYVGIGPNHPLFGFEADAVPLDLTNCVHGGITYGRECEANRFARRAYGEPRTERYTVCHVTVTRKVQSYRTVQTTKDEFEHEDLWWLGFDTDHVGDLVPQGYNRSARMGNVYRDQAYVYQECLTLAQRLKAVDGRNAKTGDHQVEQLRLPPPDCDHGED